MGSICRNLSDGGSKPGQHASTTGRHSAVPYRWSVLYIGDEWIQLRRHPAVLLESGAGRQTDEEGDRVTTRRMGEAEGDRSDRARQVPDHRCDSDVFESTGPFQPGERIRLHRMLPVSTRRRVRFSDQNDICELNDWPADVYREARKGPWIHFAADRHRFRRRIEQTELMLCDVLNNSNRDKVRRRLFQ